MSSSPLMAIAPMIGLAGLVTVHVAVCRLAGGRRRLRNLALGVVAGGGLAILVTLAALSRPAPSAADAAALVLLNAATYLALAYGYANFYNLPIASLRLRVLDELLTAEPSDGLTEGDLLARYNARGLIESRLARLRDTRQIDFREGRYYTRHCVLLAIAWWFALLKWLLLRRPLPAIQAAIRRLPATAGSVDNAVEG